MIVKPSVSFLNTNNDALLVTNIKVVIDAMTGNSNYTNPLPTIAVVSTVLDSFRAALAAAADGGKTLTSAKNDARATLDGSAAPVAGAAMYNWRFSTAAQPTVYLQTPQTTAASTSFAGLTPGTVYRVEVNAAGSAGPSDWSEAATQMAM